MRYGSTEAEGTALADELLDEVEGEGVGETDSPTASHALLPSREVNPLTGEVICTGGWAKVRVTHFKVKIAESASV